MWRRGTATDLLRRRGKAKLDAGAILEELEAEGWLTINDAVHREASVEHIAVGPAGIFTVETHDDDGAIEVASIERARLNQAHAQRKLVERITAMEVESMLVFNRAHLDQPVSRQRGVLVLPAGLLAGHLTGRQPKLTPEQVQATHRRLSALLADVPGPPRVS